MDFTANFVTLDYLLCEKVFDQKTLCERVAWTEYPRVKSVYVGDREDLEQALIVGLLEWAKTQADPLKLRESEAVAAIRGALKAELKRCRREEFVAEGGEGDEGEILNWNPYDPGDRLTPERAKTLDTAVAALAQLVGTDSMVVLRGRLIHGLTFYQIKKRFSAKLEHDPDLNDGHTAALLGYPHCRRAYTTEEVERLFTDSLARITEKYGSEKWPAVRKALEYSPPLDPRFPDSL